jgi:hypothetical protein
MTPETKPVVVVDPAVLFRNTMEAEPKAPEVPEAPPLEFKVKNRSRAQKLAKLLYGPLGRCFKVKSYNVKVDEKDGAATYKRHLHGVAVGTEQGDKRTIIGAGKTYTEALTEPIRQYVMGGKDLAETRKRFESVVGPNFREPYCEPWVFAEAAFAQFKDEIEIEKSRSNLKRG